MSSGDECYGCLFFFPVVGSFRGDVYFGGVVLMGVDQRGVFVGVCFRVFRLNTTP